MALLPAGVDLTVIRDYLGHASVATTSRYLSRLNRSHHFARFGTQREIFGIETVRAACPISAYAMAYNMLRYVLGAVPGVAWLSRIVIGNIRGQSPEDKFLSEIDNSTYAEANKSVFER